MPVNSETTPEADIAETLSQNTGSQIMRDKLHRVIRNKLPATKQMDDIAPVVTDAVIAALPDMVVPLVWVDECEFHCVELEEAKTPFGRYSAFRTHYRADYQWVLEDGPSMPEGEGFPTLEAAKDAAQAHHAAQALSAFGIAPPSTREDT